jgi:hypothetical protein
MARGSVRGLLFLLAIMVSFVTLRLAEADPPCNHLAIKDGQCVPVLDPGSYVIDKNAGCNIFKNETDCNSKKIIFSQYSNVSDLEDADNQHAQEQSELVVCFFYLACNWAPALEECDLDGGGAYNQIWYVQTECID